MPEGKWAKLDVVAEKLASASSTCVDARLQNELAKCDADILAHFAGLQQREPTAASSVPKYDVEVATTTLNAGQEYVASCPFFWLNTSFELQPNVPKYATRIVDLQRHFFPEPRPYPPEGVIVAVEPGVLPHNAIGQLKAICPPELRDAYRRAIAEAVRDPTATAENLDKWPEGMLSVPFRFKPVKAGISISALFEDVVQHRENLGIK